MNILVAGGAGFIGANFIWYWAEQHPEDNLFCIDKLTYAADVSHIKPLLTSQKCSLQVSDIADPRAMRDAFRCCMPDVVINFAAESHVDRSIANSFEFVRSNVLGVQVLLDECKRSNIRYHQISTDEVYGDLPLDSSEKFTENSLLKPSSPYSASKAAADLLVLSYWRTHKTPVTISRSTNNYGRFQNNEKLIPHMLALAAQNRPLTLYGNGENVRDWIAVYDHCRAIELILLRGKCGEIYNVGSGCEINNLTLVQKLLNLIGKSECPVVFVKDRKGHDLRYSLDCTKIEKELGWRPEIAFDEGLRQTVLWYWERLCGY